MRRKPSNRFKPYKDPVIGASVVVANNFKAWLKKRGLEHGVRVKYGNRTKNLTSGQPGGKERYSR